MLELENFVTALTNICGLLQQVIGAMQATILRQQDTPPTTDPWDISSSKWTSAVLPEEEEIKTYKGKKIAKRADGRWYARFYDHGKRRTVYGKTQNECLEKLKLALKEANKGAKPLQQYTLGEWLNKWLELYKIGKVKDTSLKKIRYTIDNMQPLLKTSLRKLTAIQVQEFLNGIDGHRKKELIYITLKDAMTKAEKNKLIADNPFDVVEITRAKKKPSNALTAEEERQFVEVCHNCKEGILYLLCLYQGLRLGEALALTYEDVDFDKKQLRVTKSLNNFNELTTPKTETSIRTLPLFRRTAEVLDPSGQGVICTYSRPVYQRTMVNICRQLNLKNISIHSLRHTFATRCAEAGVSAKVVQKWLGHSTLDMTLNVYTHVNAEFEQKEADVFDAHFDAHSSTKKD